MQDILFLDFGYTFSLAGEIGVSCADNFGGFTAR